MCGSEGLLCVLKYSRLVLVCRLAGTCSPPSTARVPRCLWNEGRVTCEPIWDCLVLVHVSLVCWKGERERERERERL